MAARAPAGVPCSSPPGLVAAVSGMTAAFGMKRFTSVRMTMLRAARALPLVAVAALLATVAPHAATAENNAAGGYRAIPNGQLYYDTAGDSIQAHGGGITKVGDTFYWWGGDANVHNDEFIGLSMYSSKDMKDWQKLPEVLSPTSKDTTGNNQILSHSKIE